MGAGLRICRGFWSSRRWLLAVCLWLSVTAGFAQPGPLCFFTKAADRMIRYSTAQWCADSFSGYTNTFGGITSGFTITNIPVLVNGSFVYTPAVNRLLQLAANVYDATTTNFYPSVFRPTFFRDASGNVFINGYQQVASVAGLGDPQLSSPREVGYLPTGYSTNVNVYGVPWIIGAKKYLPNFNQFYMENVVQVTRKMQVTRKQVEAYSFRTGSDFTTNVLYVMSISNQIGYSLWNSYATNYPGGSPTVFVGDAMSMNLVNDAFSISSGTSFNYVTNIPVWPGSAWDVTLFPALRPAAQNSFIYFSGNFAFLPPSAYQLGASGFVSLGSNLNLYTNINYLANLPQFTLGTTNWLYAYILDGSNVIDYVQFHALGSSRDLNSELVELSTNNAAQMWARTYTSNLGPANQISFSQIRPSANSSTYGWSAPGNLPPALMGNPIYAADYFKAFFTGASFVENGQVYVNNDLTNQTPYTPTRTMCDLTIWQANDPLVHYISEDLNESNAYTGFHRTDDPTLYPPPSVVQNALGQSGNVIGDNHYQPWGRNSELTLHAKVDTNAYNLSYRDPLVYGSDNWDFPDGGFPLDWLGRVHRGTPWQTVYLKSSDILALTNGAFTWSVWTGDTNSLDASWSAPINDWKLASLLVGMFNTNDLTTLLSVNNPDTNAWQVTLDGLTALTNSTATPFWIPLPELDPLLMTSNSPQAAIMASAIQSTRANRVGQNFADAGDVLATAALAEQSPFLNTTASSLVDYGISDEAYEKIPSQLLTRLRTDSIGSVTLANGQVSISFNGYDGHTYEVQTSTDLVHWSSLGTSLPVNGVYGLTATVSGTVVPQFYRTILLH